MENYISRKHKHAPALHGYLFTSFVESKNLILKYGIDHQPNMSDRAKKCWAMSRVIGPCIVHCMRNKPYILGGRSFHCTSVEYGMLVFPYLMSTKELL